MGKVKALAIIDFHANKCDKNIHSRRSVRQLQTAIALIKGENK